MRAKLTTTLGYALLAVVATVMMVYSWNSSVNFSDMLQLVVFAAGAMSLFLMTQTRSSK